MSSVSKLRAPIVQCAAPHPRSTKNSQIHSMLYDRLRNLCTRTSIIGVLRHKTQSQNAYHSTTCSTQRTVKKHELSYLNSQFVAVQPTEIPRASVEDYTTVQPEAPCSFLIFCGAGLWCGQLPGSNTCATRAATRTTSILDSTPETESPPSSQQTFKNGCLTSRLQRVTQVRPTTWSLLSTFDHRKMRQTKRIHVTLLVWTKSCTRLVLDNILNN